MGKFWACCWEFFVFILTVAWYCCSTAWLLLFFPHFLFVFIIINLYFYAFNLNILDFFWFMSFMVSRLYVFIFCCSSCFLVFSLSVIHFLFYFEAFCSLFCVFSFTSLYFITLIVFSCPSHPTCSLFQWLAYSVSVSINCPFVLCCVCFVFLPVVCLWDFLGGKNLAFNKGSFLFGSHTCWLWHGLRADYLTPTKDGEYWSHV